MPIKEIYLAGGCFWGLEEYFSQIEGVLETQVGYANGQVETTSYQLLKQTDHAETVLVRYAPEVIQLREVLLYYFRVIDPFSINQQGPDKGRQYRTGIYYTEEADLAEIQAVMTQQEEQFGRGPLAVELEPLRHFIDAEEYHQDYLKKNPTGYCHIDVSQSQIPVIDAKDYQKPADAQLLAEIQAVMTQQEEQFGRGSLAVELEPLRHFIDAEEYHQDYLKKNPTGYCHIDVSQSQIPVIDAQDYQKPADAQLRADLTPEQYAVTQEAATERPFANAFWENDEAGIYVDITTGEPLFLSTDKFDSGCGWPSFTKPISKEVALYVQDLSHGMNLQVIAISMLVSLKFQSLMHRITKNQLMRSYELI